MNHVVFSAIGAQVSMDFVHIRMWQRFLESAHIVRPAGGIGTKWLELKMKIAPLGLAGGRCYDRTNSLRTPTMKESQLLREKTTSSVFVSTCSNAVGAFD